MKIRGNSRELRELIPIVRPVRSTLNFFSRVILLALALTLSLLGTGCGVSGSSPGRLEVRVRDHREAIDDFSELWLTFSTVSIHPAGQPRSEGWIELEPAVQRLDLTQYVEGREAV